MDVAPAAGARAGTTVEVVWCPDGEHEVDLVLTIAPAATVGDLLTALGSDQDLLFIDGSAVTGNTPLRECALRRGSTLQLRAQAEALKAVPVVSVSVMGGGLTGQHHDLAAGTWTLGRSTVADVQLDSPTVSTNHAVVRVAADGAVEIEDCSSTNGTWVDGVHASAPTAVAPDAVVQVGALLLSIRPDVPAAAAHAAIGGTGIFNRPPRQLPAQTQERLELPTARTDDGPTARLSWIAMLAPLALGAVMALFYDPRFALFALFSPLMMLGTWLDDRRRVRRTRRGEDRRLQTELDRLREDIAAAGRGHAISRRRRHPGPAEAMRRAGRRAPTLWERRAEDPDFLDVLIGFGSVEWEPEVTTPGRGAADECAEVLKSMGRLEDMPVTTPLRPGAALGIAGDRESALALVRGVLLQIAGFSGPADVRIAVVCDPDRSDAWDWAKWLPHSRDPMGAAGQVLVAATQEAHEMVAAAAADAGAATTVFVVDGDALLTSRGAAVRRVLAGGHASAIVCAPSPEALPSVCTSVVTVAGCDGLAVVTDGSGTVREDVLLCGVDGERAREVALALASISDPEAVDGAAALPERAAASSVLGMGDVSAEALLRRWRSGGDAVAPIGVSSEGPVFIDLEADGPHGLIAGTTGSGKSELLRTIVVGLAANASPEDLTFVLVDYKGGSAFDECARLPHTVGLVTDLDENLGRRALCCLEAELRHRERVLRDAGVADLTAYRLLARSRDLAPIPRLVIAVDEFATLVAELPDFVDRLVAVAQRGRSLGLHLLLATQKPSGAVSDQIRANTNLRIALRVQDAADSSDVIASPAAAQLSRRLPGRGYLRLGHGELVAFQTAISSARPAKKAPPVAVQPFAIGWRCHATAPVEADEDSELSLIVAAAAEAFAASGLAPPRRPWPDPLPSALSYTALTEMALSPGSGYAIGIADDPENQQQLPFSFEPGRGGLLLYGATLPSGPTSALATIVAAVASDPDIDCYVIDAGAQALAELEGLPGVAAVVRGGHRRGQERLVQYLSEELERRRSARGVGHSARTMLVVVDNYAGFAATFDDLDGLRVLDTFTRIAAEGPAFGIVPVITADRVNAVPPAIASTIGRRLLFRLSDLHDYGQFGVPAPAPDDMPDLRAIDTVSGLHVQIAAPPAAPADVVVAGARPPAEAAPVDDLPAAVDLQAILDDAAFDAGEWRLPLGLDDRALRPAGWRLGAGDHALITGPARSGKSTALVVITEIAAKVAGDVTIHAVALRRSPLRDSPYVERVAASTEEFEQSMRAIAGTSGPTLLLIDDADMTDDMSGLLSGLLAERRDDLWCIAAGRADVLRSQYGHWTTEVRRSPHGLALRPNLDLDGDLWHTPLPRRCRDQLVPGRGFLITEGSAELLQVARP